MSLNQEADVREFVISYLSKKNTLPESSDIDQLKYIDEGFIDSLGIMRFAFEIEEAFNIELAPDDLTDEKFRTVGGVIEIVCNKIDK